MNCKTLLSKEDIKIIYEHLNIEPIEKVSFLNEEYYNFWDFGKEPDDSQAVSTISADISLL